MDASITESEGAQPLRMRGRWGQDALFAVLLMVATLAAYWPALHGGFLWDDDDHISKNPALHSLTGLRDIWLRPGATCQYYPLSFTGFWIGYQLWGLNTTGYHVLNVMLHGIVALLLWQVLARLRAPGARLAGAFFALHPVCVMSVAWMTELKNTLSGALALGAIWAYVRFAGLGVYQRPEGNAEGQRWRCYVLCLLLFQLALFAKTAVSFVPVTLLLIVWWQRERIGWREVWPLLAMLGLAVMMGQLTFSVERHTGATGREFDVGLLDRVLISGRSFWFYLGKLFFPYRLTFIYERWAIDAGAWWSYLYPAATAGLLWGLWRMRKRTGKGPFAAMLHFYVATSLLILLVVLYMTRFTWVSDHWQYFGCMSVMALAAAGISRLAETFAGHRPWLTPACGGALLLGLGILTWRQCGMYSGLETLWRTTIARNPRCWMAHDNLAGALYQSGREAEAMAHFRKSLEIRPAGAFAHNGLGIACIRAGQVDEAILHFQKVVAVEPDDTLARNNLANLLFQKGRLDEAIVHFQKVAEREPGNAYARSKLGDALLLQGQVDKAAEQFLRVLEIEPNNASARRNMGDSLLRRGQPDEAIPYFRKSLEIEPGNAKARRALGSALMFLGQWDEAIAQLEKSLALEPGNANAHGNLGNALLRKRRLNEAIGHYDKALEIEPDNVNVLNSLARVLAISPEASVRNGARAVELMQRAIRLSGDHKPGMLTTLAAAYAEAGRFPEAAAAARRALDLAAAQNDVALANLLQRQITLYQSGSPYRDHSLTNAPSGGSR
jgi:protein O-mannosyl-transferase